MIIAYLQIDRYEASEDRLGFIVLSMDPDRSGTVPVRRRDDGEYMCIRLEDISCTVTDNLWIRFYNQGVEINPTL